MANKKVKMPAIKLYETWKRDRAVELAKGILEHVVACGSLKEVPMDVVNFAHELSLLMAKDNVLLKY